MGITVMLFFLLILTASMVGMCYRKAGTVSEVHPDAPPLFAALWSGVTAIVYLFVLFFSSEKPQFLPITVLLGCIGGLFFAVASNTYIHAMKNGPFIWNVLIMNLSSFLPVLFSCVFLGEAATLKQVFGIILILSVVVIMSINTKALNNKIAFSSKWLIIIIVAFLTNGGINSVMKLHEFYMEQHGIALSQLYEYSFVLFASTSFFSLLYFILRKGSFVHFPYKSFAVAGSGLVVTLGLSQLFNMLLVKRVSGLLQFSIPAGLVILISALIGVVFYKEKPTKKLAICMTLAIAGILLL